MSSTTELSPFNERDFRAIEAAVLETEKGRWFLNEFGRRNRVADTETLLGALSRLERNLTSQDAPDLEEHPDIAALSNAIDATRNDIGAVRNDMLKDSADIPADKAVFSFLSENAHQISVDLIATAEALQGTVSTLRTDSNGASHADAIDGHVHTLFDGGWRQDVLAQRISKAMGLLEHLDQNLKALAGKPAAPLSMAEISRSLPTALSPENLKFFDGDDEMFTAGDKPGDTEPAKLDLEILKTGATEVSPEEPAATQSEDDEPAKDEPQEVVKAITEPEPHAAEEPDSAEQEAEPEQAAIDVPPPVEPNIIIVRRGKSTSSTDNGGEVDRAESTTDDSTITPSETAENPAEVVTVETSDQSSESTQDKPVADDQPADTTDKAAVNEVVSASTQAAQDEETATPANDDQTDNDAKAVLADMDLDGPDAPVSTTAHSAEDALNAFADMAASEPQVQDEVPAPGTTDDEKPAATDNDDADKERIVVIRRSTSEEAEIPFADYLGVEPQLEPQSNTGSAS